MILHDLQDSPLSFIHVTHLNSFIYILSSLVHLYKLLGTVPLCRSKSTLFK